jgi:MbtH protein
MDRDADQTRYGVVVNHEEQYSIWPANRELPPGWQRVGESMDKQGCLDYIEKVWTDMRPRSLREAMAQRQGGTS